MKNSILCRLGIRSVRVLDKARSLFVRPHYPTGGGGRPAIDLERMLRIYFLQQWFNLGDPTVEEALYDSRAMEAFARIDLGREPVPDETTICRFRHLLEHHGLGPALLEEFQRTFG